MRKTLKSQNIRALLAMSLVASLAAFGCTTNRTHGEGEPYMGAPGVGPMAPTSNTSGSSVPTTPPPMTSSYRGNEQALATRPHRLTPDEAALIMADQLPKVRVLGPANPGPARAYASDQVVTGQTLNYAGLNPGQVTVNSTLNSPATPVVTSGTDQSGDAAAAIFAPNIATATPTTAAIAVTPGAVAGGTALAATPTATAANVTATPTASTTTGTTTTLTPTTASAAVPAPTATTGTAGATVRTLNSNAITNATANGNVRVTTANGRVTVTNVSTKSGRSQQ